MQVLNDCSKIVGNIYNAMKPNNVVEGIGYLAVILSAIRLPWQTAAIIGATFTVIKLCTQTPADRFNPSNVLPVNNFDTKNPVNYNYIQNHKVINSATEQKYYSVYNRAADELYTEMLSTIASHGHILVGGNMIQQAFNRCVKEGCQAPKIRNKDAIAVGCLAFARLLTENNNYEGRALDHEFLFSDRERVPSDYAKFCQFTLRDIQGLYKEWTPIKGY